MGDWYPTREEIEMSQYIEALKTILGGLDSLDDYEQDIRSENQSEIMGDITYLLNVIKEMGSENQRMRESLETIASTNTPSNIYGEGVYWWCVETAEKALGESDD